MTQMMALNVWVWVHVCARVLMSGIQMYVLSPNMEDRQLCLLIHVFLLSNPYRNAW